MGGLAGALRDARRLSGQGIDGLVSRAVQAITPGPAQRPSGEWPPPRPGPAIPPRANGAANPGPARPFPESRPRPAAIDRGRLRPGPFVILGECLAAGVANFSLGGETQANCFPALVARQAGIPFAQPCFEPPGLPVPGLSPLPVIAPGLLQTTLYRPTLPTAPFSNLSVPGLTIADASRLRPREPVICPGDSKQTAANLILGAPWTAGGDSPGASQLETACRQGPALAMVALGFHEFMEASAIGDPGRLPAVAAAADGLAQVVRALVQAGSDILLLTIPDPLDTAYFATVEAAARLLRVPAEYLARSYRLRPGDRLSLYGLLEVAYQLLAEGPRPLDRGCVLAGAAADAISGRVRELNAAIQTMGHGRGVLVYDLAGLFRGLANTTVSVGSRRVSPGYLGGIYTLNGLTPGQFGHALIANELLQALGSHYGASLPPVDLAGVLAVDPATDYRNAEGPDWTPSAAAGPGRRTTTRVPDVTVRGRETARRGSPESSRGRRLQLPDGLEQVLPLHAGSSYHSDGIQVESAPAGSTAIFGGTGNLVFGGLLLFGSHLRGSIRIRFSPPANDITRFEVDFLDGLEGDDGVLSAPVYFRLPVRQARVVMWPGSVASGMLDLATGEVSQLDFKVSYLNSALDILRRANPAWPSAPISFPGTYGSAWARFEPRGDGKLDFTFSGTTFIPLSTLFRPVRFALAFGGGCRIPASVPAEGTALHPHLQLSTKAACATGAGGAAEAPLDLPVNSVEELTLQTHNSSFGDGFELNLGEFGGDARGRSHLLGRLQVQFGEPFGRSVPFAVAGLPPGGLLAVPAETPLAAAFPGRLPAGLMGHDEFLRFPLRTFFLDSVSLIDDPFDIVLGAVDLDTGEVIGGQLHRAFIGQNLFYALVRVEPRTPRSSFFFRGPARFERGPAGSLIYRFRGEVDIPYPDGFLFPAPDLATGYRVGPGSRLVPFLRLQGMTPDARAGTAAKGGAKDVLASNGQRFSFRYEIAPGGGRGAFEYVNHTQGARFRMSTLFWAEFTSSPAAPSTGRPADTVSFVGHGTWCRGTASAPAFVAAQVSTSPRDPYVSIQVGGGQFSNVNTKPEDESCTLP